MATEQSSKTPAPGPFLAGAIIPSGKAEEFTTTPIYVLADGATHLDAFDQLTCRLEHLTSLLGVLFEAAENGVIDDDTLPGVVACARSLSMECRALARHLDRKEG